MWSVDNLPQVAFLQTQDPHMRYQPHVVFPRPRVAYPHKQNMRYQPHVAFPQPRVALPQLHHLQHMRYWPHVALPSAAGGPTAATIQYMRY